ncbi:MAG TPA: cobalt-precorrin-6A reductase [Pseudonocardiaceae bacterium]|nr:cobalt-precorrin-6A reductase [Pseudonocardiaceae bacterium]
MTVRVLLLGGTAEARRLASLLATDQDLDIVSSLAGRVRAPTLPVGEVRIGGFGGPAGLADWLAAERIDAVIDATHPFAATITANANEATGRLGVPFVVLRRPGWQQGPADDWHWVDTVADAATRLPALGRRVFLATGRGDLAAFADRDDLWFLLRAVDPPPPPLPANRVIVRGRGPFDVPGELALLRHHRVDVVVARDSGGDHVAAKLTAANTLGLPVLVARRPPLPDVPVVTTERAAADWLAGVRHQPS